MSRTEVEAVARLARLALDDAELGRVAAELTGILDHMAELRTLDLAGVEPFATAAEHVAPARADERGTARVVAPEQNAPEWQDGFFIVPRVIGAGETHDDAS